MYNVTKRLPFYACLRTPKLSSRISGVGYRRQSCVAPDHLGNSSMRKKHQAIGVTATFTGHPGAFSLESGFLQGCRRAVNLVMPVGHMINRILHGHLPAEPEPLVRRQGLRAGIELGKELDRCRNLKLQTRVQNSILKRYLGRVWAKDQF